MKRPFLFVWLAAAALLLFFWIYFPVLSRYRDLKIQEEGLRREIDEINAKIKALHEERQLLKNDVAYLEKVIRDELGLVKPGEVVYKFVPETPEPSAEEKEAEEAYLFGDFESPAGAAPAKKVVEKGVSLL